MRISKFASDPKKIEEGVWIPAGEDLKLQIRRANNPDYQACIRKLGRSLLPSIKAGRGEDNAEELIRISRVGVSKHVLIGWENLQDDDGKLIIYSEAKALELLTTHRDFYDMVMEFANDAALFRQDQLEDDAKN